MNDFRIAETRRSLNLLLEIRFLPLRFKPFIAQRLRGFSNFVTGGYFRRIERLNIEIIDRVSENRRTIRKIRNALHAQGYQVWGGPSGVESVTANGKKPEKISKDDEKRAALSAAYMVSSAYSDMMALKNVFKGRRIFIIGNGPSLNSQDLSPLRNEITMCTNWFLNHPDYAHIAPKFHTVSSHEMFGGWGNPAPELNKDWHEKSKVLTANTTKVFPFRFQPYVEQNALYPKDECRYLIFDRPKELMDVKRDINLDVSQPMIDGYTGILTFCIPLAHHLGASEIYLLGCDCDYGLTTPDADKKYFYDYSQHTSRTTKFESLNRIWAENGPVFQAYEVARDRLASDGVKIYNATAGGRLEVFPRVSLHAVLSTTDAMLA